MSNAQAITTQSRSSTVQSRRNFLRGKRNESHPIRPPWSLSEDLFVDACERCDKCVTVCEENILVRGSGGFPEVSFNQGECTFCEDCVDACPSGAIQKSNQEHAFSHVVAIADSCFNKKGIVCQSCRDECEARAIGLLWESSIPVPVVDEDACTGCGACIKVCPNQSVTVKPL